MQTTITRKTYAEQTAAVAREILTAEEYDAHIRRQYPKSAELAAAELRFRGVDVGSLPDDHAYTMLELDRIVDAAETCGWLTAEAQDARNAGLTLVDFRGGSLVPREV